ncbi:trafficking protein particle complex subunit 2-like protein isoform X1 [Eptesicus fuscus]|uniref:trafficking protein particle complex subunit 2-like protein isoform X1 n=1 Tax=Eptesicus fuscus TaxID=29078 RepID=UPI00240439F4|nr:trafficking protein particle complex subunit 2-like protein isoform X1 [Eptesicus fuscus]
MLRLQCPSVSSVRPGLCGVAALKLLGAGFLLSYSTNYPLYIRSVPTENELKFHYMVHTSLDVVDEKISAMGKALVDQRELYLGLLYPTEDYKVYGYVTNSKVKFVMVVDSSNTALRDNEIRSMFRKLHNSYTDVMCNPFYNPGDRIQSRAFDSMVTSMMIQVC